MMRAWNRVLAECGATGLAAFVIIAASLLFLAYFVRPLEEASQELDRQLARALRNGRSSPEASRTAPTTGRGLEGFYAFFDRPETPTDWLAKFHGAALSTNVAIRSAEYKVIESKKRVERYQLTAPVAGGYAQIRAFIDVALAEIPVLSLDQVRMRRARSGSGIEAELVFSIYERRE